MSEDSDEDLLNRYERAKFNHWFERNYSFTELAGSRLNDPVALSKKEDMFIAWKAGSSSSAKEFNNLLKKALKKADRQIAAQIRLLLTSVGQNPD
jgi:hypothetical protein